MGTCCNTTKYGVETYADFQGPEHFFVILKRTTVAETVPRDIWIKYIHEIGSTVLYMYISKNPFYWEDEKTRVKKNHETLLSRVRLHADFHGKESDLRWLTLCEWNFAVTDTAQTLCRVSAVLCCATKSTCSKID